MARVISADGARAGALIIERSYREGDDKQFLRELVQNGLEADATKIQLGIHWPSAAPGWEVEGLPENYPYTIYPSRYRLAYYDNGHGMGDRMLDYMTGLLDLDSKDQAIGHLHGNFAMGVRVSTLPWNKAGVIIASWTQDCPEGRLMWLRYVADSTEALGYYEAATLRWEDDDGTPMFSEVAPADVFPEFVSGRPDWLGFRVKDSGEIGPGTMFLFLGNTGREHTFLGPDESWSTHTGPNYLTHRYFRHDPADVEIRYEDPRTSDVQAWASRRRDRENRTTLDGSDAAPNDRIFNEPVRPTEGLMAGYFSKSGEPQLACIPLPDGGRIHVSLLPPTVAQTGGGRRSAEKPGISVLYKDELYHRKDAARDYQRFAISSSKIYRRLSIIIEPRQANDVTDPEGGVFPTSSRTSLNYVHPDGSKLNGRDMPWGTWEQVFIDNMPQFVVDAIEAAIPDDYADVDQDIVDKVAQPYMDMFKQISWVQNEGGGVPGTSTGESVAGMRRRRRSGPGQGPSQPEGAGDTSQPPGTEGGAEEGELRQIGAAIPECKFDGDSFGDEERSANPRIGVKYIKGPTGRVGKVLVDPDYPLIQDVTKYWIEHTAPPQHEDAKKAVRVVYATAMACRVGQILSLAKDSKITMDELQKNFMSNEALTASLFGLASEHAVIKARLAPRLKRPST
ncbi:hypothetical protein [Nocardia asiatica]|uniref:hypothetical protein n=1 Tax=Nocardia asiatica TaxID=209252 RepID=UPI0024584B57|nr:hypothetical protein [Nocardia asiatica]